jgi:hypothetical protein
VLSRLQEGQPGTLAHRAHRRPYNNRLCEKRRQKALALIGGRHSDFGPTLAAEKVPSVAAGQIFNPRHQFSLALMAA